MEIGHQHQPPQLLLPLLKQLFILGKQVKGHVILQKLDLVEFAFLIGGDPNGFHIRELYSLFVFFFAAAGHFFVAVFSHEEVIVG